MLGRCASAVAALGGVLLCAPVHAAEPEPETGFETAIETEPDPGFETAIETGLGLEGPPPQAEVVPVPRHPADPSRSGRGLLATGGVLLSLGAAVRFGIEGFWVGPAQLRASEPFGQWSVPTIAFFTGFSNVLVVPGLVVTGFGARRYGAWRVASGAWPDDPARTRRHRRLGQILLGGGLSLWVATRTIALPVLRSCETNGCAYGYLESTFWLSLGASVSGVALVGLATGEQRVGGRIAVTPMLGPQGRGLSVGGRF